MPVNNFTKAVGHYAVLAKRHPRSPLPATRVRLSAKSGVRGDLYFGNSGPDELIQSMMKEAIDSYH